MNADQIERVLRATRHALTVFGNPARATGWLSRPNRVLRAAVPAELAARSEETAAEVERELERVSRGAPVPVG